MDEELPIIKIDNQSILNTIKKLLGLTPEYTLFDVDIITHINTVFSSLNEMGIGPEEGFHIEGEDENWSDFIDGGESNDFQSLKTLIYTKVKIIFDPPQNSNLLTALNKTASEIEWRLYTKKGGY